MSQLTCRTARLCWFTDDVYASSWPERLNSSCAKVQRRIDGAPSMLGEVRFYNSGEYTDTAHHFSPLVFFIEMHWQVKSFKPGVLKLLVLWSP